jgi:hypothetical protein
MEISDDELRTMVRDAIARHGRGGSPGPAVPPEPAALPHIHPSHGRLALVSGGDPEGRCLIEPAVACTHCGFCQSMGH